jgi:uncharacterized protein
MGKEAGHVEMLKDAYARWRDSKGEHSDHWLAIVDDNIKFGSLAQGAPRVDFLTAYNSRDALAHYFKGILDDWEMVHFSADEYVAQGDAVVMRGMMAWRHKKTGKTVETPKVDFWRFRDGKAVEFYEYYDTARVIAAAHPDPNVAVAPA